MTWLHWLLVGYFTLGIVVSIASVGKPRVPMTPGGAIIGLVINGLLIWVVVAIAQGVS